jgi:hypothetical protein
MRSSRVGVLIAARSLEARKDLEDSSHPERRYGRIIENSSEVHKLET